MQNSFCGHHPSTYKHTTFFINFKKSSYNHLPVGQWYTSKFVEQNNLYDTVIHQWNKKSELSLIWIIFLCRYICLFDFWILFGWRTPHHLSQTRGYISPWLIVKTMPWCSGCNYYLTATQWCLSVITLIYITVTLLLHCQ